MRTYSDFDPGHRPHGLKAAVRWGIVDRLTGARKIAPPGPGAPRVDPDLELIRSAPAAQLTWIGHASFLGSLGGARFLIDPNFSRRIGGFIPRHVPPGLEIRDLPEVDLVLITHSVPMHWGTFQLTDEPLAEPAKRIRAWWRETSPAGREMHLLAVGETLVLGEVEDKP